MELFTWKTEENNLDWTENLFFNGIEEIDTSKITKERVQKEIEFRRKEYSSEEKLKVISEIIANPIAFSKVWMRSSMGTLAMLELYIKVLSEKD